jgi:putative lipoic acid-binding regulatory protein
MFTLSEKIKVLNTDAALTTSPNKLVKALDASDSNAVLDDVSGVASADKLVVEGFGNFPISKIVDIRVERAVAAANDSKDFLCEAITGLAEGDAIEVIVSISTGRYQAEILAQNHIGNGRTIKFSTLPFGSGLLATDIRTAIVAGWDKYKELFNIGTPFIDIANGASTSKINVSSTSTYESITIDKVEIRRVAQGVAIKAPKSLAATSITVGTEGKGQGKFLEESVRMATSCNNEAYGVDTTDTRVDIRGNYTSVSFSVQAEYDEKLSIVAADAPVGTAIHKFVLYLNEATCLAAEGAIDLFANIALVVQGVSANGKTKVGLATPLTIAEETTEVLFIDNGGTTDTVARFLANDATGQS